MTIYLCGFMGCGKTTVGESLAIRLGVPLIDTDAYIVEKAGKSIPEIFAQDGEPAFRAMETETLEELGKQNAVIACGGGAMINPKNSEIARKFGAVVLIDTPWEICYERIRDDENRPIVQRSTTEELKALFDKRHGIYSQAASVIVDGSGSPFEITERILKNVR